MGQLALLLTFHLYTLTPRYADTSFDPLLRYDAIQLFNGRLQGLYVHKLESRKCAKKKKLLPMDNFRLHLEELHLLLLQDAS